MTHCTDGKTFRLGGQAQYSHDVCCTPGGWKSHSMFRTEGLCVHTRYMKCTICIQYTLYKELTKSHVLNGYPSPTTLNLLFCCCMDTYNYCGCFYGTASQRYPEPLDDHHALHHLIHHLASWSGCINHTYSTTKVNYDIYFVVPVDTTDNHFIKL